MGPLGKQGPLIVPLCATGGWNKKSGGIMYRMTQINWSQCFLGVFLEMLSFYLFSDKKVK